jgi:hypothetical protein
MSQKGTGRVVYGHAFSFPMNPPTHPAAPEERKCGFCKDGVIIDADWDRRSDELIYMEPAKEEQKSEMTRRKGRGAALLSVPWDRGNSTASEPESVQMTTSSRPSSAGLKDRLLKTLGRRTEKT